MRSLDPGWRTSCIELHYSQRFAYVATGRHLGKFVFSLATVNTQAFFVIDVVDYYNLHSMETCLVRLYHHKASVLSAWQ